VHEVEVETLGPLRTGAKGGTKASTKSDLRRKKRPRTGILHIVHSGNAGLLASFVPFQAREGREPPKVERGMKGEGKSEGRDSNDYRDKFIRARKGKIRLSR